MTRGTITLLKYGAAVAALAGITAAAAAHEDLYPVNICLTADHSTHPCVLHVDDEQVGWFLVDVASIDDRLPNMPFPEGTNFRVTGNYCTTCIAVFCGSFRGFVFGAELVPCIDGDATGNGYVDVEDLVDVISNWGQCPDSPASCLGDTDGDDVVGVGDLVSVIENWGS